MAGKRKRVEAVGYMRTSSAANVGTDKDSEKRQRAAIEGYAKAASFVVVEWFYDAAIKGADSVTARPGFSAMPHSRQCGLARDLAVQLAGQFDKATMVAKLKAARDRKHKVTGKVEGRKSYIEREGGLGLIARVKALRDQRPRLSLREIAAELEREVKVTTNGNRYSASAIQSMLESG
jgi:hypothetical protein